MIDTNSSSEKKLIVVIYFFWRQTATYSWQWRWRSCAPGCPRCWPLCSCRIRRQQAWRPAGSAWALGPGHWGGGARGNAPRWQWEPGIPLWCHRTAANPAQDPPPLCRSPTDESLEALEGRDGGGERGATPGCVYRLTVVLDEKLLQTDVDNSVSVEKTVFLQIFSFLLVDVFTFCVEPSRLK